MNLDMSMHAKVRAQQRGIPPLVVDLLQRFGSEAKAADGVRKIFFDKSARRRLRAFAGPLAAVLDKYLDVYAVLSEGESVITVAHRLVRIRRC